MIHDVAKKLNSVLTPEDLALLEIAFARMCESRGLSPALPPAQESAKVLITYTEWNSKQVSAGGNADWAKVSVRKLMINGLAVNASCLTRSRIRTAQENG